MFHIKLQLGLYQIGGYYYLVEHEYLQNVNIYTNASSY